MNFLKRATPWMITLLILLGAYWASYIWYYKPKPAGSYDKWLNQFYMPMYRLDEERFKQKFRKQLLRQCQGDWEGHVRPRSEEFTNQNPLTRVRATVIGDQFKITWAESMPELVGASWKIGSQYDVLLNFGFSSNVNYPKNSSIIVSFGLLPSGEEALEEGATIYTYETTDQLVRPASNVTAIPEK